MNIDHRKKDQVALMAGQYLDQALSPEEAPSNAR